MAVAADPVDPPEVEYDKEICGWRFKPRGLDITWGDNPKYWKIPEKGTADPAELKMVSWLEIKGSTPKPLSKGERYALSFKISLKDTNFCNWDKIPVFMLAKVGKKGRANWAKIYVAAMGINEEIIEVPQPKLLFEVPKNTEDTVLYFGLYELWSGEWKGGLRIHEAVVEEMPD